MSPSRIAWRAPGLFNNVEQLHFPFSAVVQLLVFHLNWHLGHV